MITPDIGLTIWTLVVFVVSLFILKKAVFPRIGEALERRQKVIEESIDAAENTRREADELLAEYRESLREARRQSEEIIERARQSAAAIERDARDSARERGDRMLEQTRREMESESRRMIDEILRDVAELTVLATERVTRKSLTGQDQRKLVEDALSELDFTALGGGVSR